MRIMDIWFHIFTIRSDVILSISKWKGTKVPLLAFIALGQVEEVKRWLEERLKMSKVPELSPIICS